MTDSEQNFARYTRSYWNDHPEEQASIVQENVARIHQGVGVWNAFDQAFVTYLEENDIEDGFYAFIGAELSNIKFWGAQFSGKTNFENAKFSGYADFSNAVFSGESDFSNAKINGKSNFGNATFSGDTDFRGAQFSDNAYFTDVTFGGESDFTRAGFGGKASFTDAKFNGDTDFGNAIFIGDTYFGGTTFDGKANFTDAKFSGESNFANAVFIGESDFSNAVSSGDVDFTSAKFGGYADFIDATFETRCSFYQAKSEKNVPNFIGAQYKTAPLIEGFKIPWVKDLPEVDIEAYRQLKKFAIEGANHEQEVRFFGFETRCKMYLDYPALTRFSIRLYWVFSNFGQSLIRPLGALVLVWIVATAMTIATTMKTPIPTALSSLIMFEYLEPCEAIPSNAFRSKLDAIRSQSIGSSLTLPVIAMDRDTQHQRNQCLYGQGGGVPETNRIINGTQQVLSLIFLFLFGLAVRNRFKIK